MLDIKFIRDNIDLVKRSIQKKHLNFDLERLLNTDTRRLMTLKLVEEARAKQNVASGKIATASPDERKRLVVQMTLLKKELKEREVELAEIMKPWRTLMLEVPNVPDVSVPDGLTEKDNVTQAIVGEKPKFDFTPLDHIALLTALGWVEFERGVKAHGFRGYFLKGEGADLSWAIWNYTRDFFAKKQFVPVITPAILKKEFFYATGHLPRESEDLYKTQDEEYLSGTAEVAMMAYHAGEVLEASELPKRYLAFSPCYRREAGSYGRDVKGLIRVHEFYKFEQLVIGPADHEESVKLHEEINRNYEELIESFDLSYRRVLICGGDLSPSKVKQYDTEIWFPSTQTYREGSSASYYHDFQTRRFNIRYKDGETEKPVFAHSLNCTAAATPRLLAAVVENYQRSDGTINVPKALGPYLGGRMVLGSNEDPRST